MTSQIDFSKKAADNIRILSAAMVEKAKSGHPGGAMGGADFINILFSEFLQFDPSDPHWIGRDRFFLDPGHMSPMLYGVLAMYGKYSMEELKKFRQWGSQTPGHPELNVERGIENTSGPLGQGHAMAVGAAIVERFLFERFGNCVTHKTFAFVSDGGIQEEISQGAGRIAGTLGLSNLILFYDSNDIQLSTNVNEVSSEDTAMKYQAWDWRVYKIDGNDNNEIRLALKAAIEETEKPVIIIGKTKMAKGAINVDGKPIKNRIATHGQPLSAAGASFEKTIEILEGDPKNPFQIFEELKEYRKNILNCKKKIALKKKALQAKWEVENTALAKKLYRFFAKNNIPKIDYASIAQAESQATRSSSSTVLAEFAKQIDNMIVCSADLSNSDKTDGFLKQTTAFKKGDFSGAFLQAGVNELTMAAICNGMSLHGGVIPACGTFFVFSDYMKPAIRLSALMELPVKYIWTHDAFRVGEDGPTHQPVEQEAQIRLMEQLKNHSGNPSMLVLRPADSAETTVAWKMAMENTQTPSALILSRQGVKDLPAKKNRFKEALQAQKGAYTVMETSENPDVILIANGSEVATLIDSAQILKEKENISSRIVSVISETLFKQQSTDYQENILPKNIPVFGLTAGLPATLKNLTGEKGTVYGLEHFGYSAPAKVLDGEFGFTGENIAGEIKNFFKKQ